MRTGLVSRGGVFVAVLLAVVATVAVGFGGVAQALALAHTKTGGGSSMSSTVGGVSMAGGSMKGASCIGAMNEQRLEAYGISVVDMRHMEMPGPKSCIPFRPTLEPQAWGAEASSSATGHPASAVLRTRAGGYWQSARLGRGSRLPQTITIRLRTAEYVTGITYVPRAGLGEIGRFRVSVSGDGRHFGSPVAYGRWQDNPTTKEVGWTPRLVRAVRVTVLSLSPRGSVSVAIARLVLAGEHQRSANERHAMELAHQALPASTNPSVVGQWGPTIAFPLIPVAAALVPGDKLVVWSADEDLDFTSNASPYTQTALLNLATGAITQATVSSTAHNMFCPGVSILPNGEVIVTGGLSDNLTSIYNPTTNAWSAGPQMNVGRGYQGQTTLSDGQAFVLGGSWSGAIGGKLGEVYSPTGAWRELTNVPANPIYTNDAQGVYRADNHGWFIATSGGNVFQAGPSAEMHWIATTGAGSITNAAPRGSAGDEMNGNAVLYDVDKILTVGGAPDYQDSNATNVANIVNISGGPGSTPTVTATSPMSYPRGFANSVALPNGQVFTVGGETYPIPFDDSTSVMYPEIWNPSTGQWTVMAEQAEPRNYHSVAVLLPDGTVFSGGGGLCGSCSVNHPDGQVFYPPYLFNADGSLATRPTITSAPANAVTGQTISVTTGGPVQSFVLMRYDEATHAVDNDQRRIPLTIASQSANTYTMTIPSDPGVALPGPYMLFATNAQGTPSISATIVISTPAMGVPTTTYGQAVYSDGPAIYWPLNDAAGSASAADLSGNRDPGAYGSSGVTYGVPSPVEGASGQGVTLNGGRIIASQPQYTPTTYTEEAWFKTTTTGGGVIMRFGDSPTGADTNNDRVVYMTTGGRLYFGTWTGQTNMVESPGGYNDGKWHFVVATQGSDGMHLYVDGQQVASSTITGNQSYTGYFQIGGTVTNGWPNQPSSAFAGNVSDSAMYLGELTGAQVHATYAASPASVTTPTPAYVADVLGLHPSTYWRLNDTSAAAGAVDASGNGDAGSYSSSGVTYGVSSPVEGPGGLGITLNGSTGDVLGTAPQPAPTVYTEALWFETTTAGGALATFGNSVGAANSNQDRTIYLTSGGQLAFGTWTGVTNVITSPSTYTDGKWHLVVATQGSDGMHLYLDGKQVVSNTIAGNQSYTGYWQLGIPVNNGWPNRATGRFAGSLSDASLWDGTELTAAQVQTLYAAG